MATGINTGFRYQALADKLRKLLKDGPYAVGTLFGSEHELSREQNVSRVTVRKASQLLVEEGLLERRPGKGLFVRSVQGARAGVIQVVAGNLAWEPCLKACRGVQEAARRGGVQVQIYDAHGSMELVIEQLRRLPDSQVSGAIIISLHAQAFVETLYDLHRRRFPFVMVDQRLRDLEVPSVTADNYDGGYRLGRLLLDAGHRRIAFIGYLVADTVMQRLSGLRDAIADAGLPFDRSLVAEINPDDRLGDWSHLVEPKTAELLGRAQPPTAIFASCDAVARSVYRAASAVGRRIPADLSVVGFDDDPLAQVLSPALTTVRQPFDEMGRSAFELLERLIADPSCAVEHRSVAVEVVARGSCARATS